MTSARGGLPSRVWRGAPPLLAALLVLAGCRLGPGSAHADYLLVLSDGYNLYDVRDAQPGEPLFFDLFAGPVLLRDGAPTAVHLLKVDILGLPKGIAVDRVSAVKLGTSGHLIEVGRGADYAAEIRPKMEAVAAATIRHCLRGGNLFCQGWTLIGELHVVTPGTYRSTGLRATYEADGHTLTQEIPWLLIGATTTNDTIPLPPAPP